MEQVVSGEWSPLERRGDHGYKRFMKGFWKKRDMRIVSKLRLGEIMSSPLEGAGCYLYLLAVLF